MQSDSGIANLAIEALIEGDQGGHLSYYRELVYRNGTRSANRMLSRRIVTEILSCTKCNRKRINPLYQRLVELLGRPQANATMLQAFVKAALREQRAEVQQKLYKIACRNVSSVQATEEFLRRGIKIKVPTTLMCSIPYSLTAQTA